MLWEWGTAILVASLLGSGQCVGMCGPFAVLATGAPSTGTRSSQANWPLRLTTLASYHIGRLATYLMIGALMGALGSVADGLAIGSG